MVLFLAVIALGLVLGIPLSIKEKDWTVVIPHAVVFLVLSVFIQIVIGIVILSTPPTYDNDRTIALDSASVYATVTGKHSRQAVGFSYVYNGKLEMKTMRAGDVDIIVDESISIDDIGVVIREATYCDGFVADYIFVFGKQTGTDIAVIAPSEEAGAKWLVEQMSLYSAVTE